MWLHGDTQGLNRGGKYHSSCIRRTIRFLTWPFSSEASIKAIIPDQFAKPFFFKLQTSSFSQAFSTGFWTVYYGLNWFFRVVSSYVERNQAINGLQKFKMQMHRYAQHHHLHAYERGRPIEQRGLLSICLGMHCLWRICFFFIKKEKNKQLLKVLYQVWRSQSTFLILLQKHTTFWVYVYEEFVTQTL